MASKRSVRELLFQYGYISFPLMSIIILKIIPPILYWLWSGWWIGFFISPTFLVAGAISGEFIFLGLRLKGIGGSGQKAIGLLLRIVGLSIIVITLLYELWIVSLVGTWEF